MKFRTFCTAAAAVALSGCAVGPDYVAPAPPAPAQAPLIEAADAAFVPAEPPAEWWRLFRAPVLDRLVDEALANNTDLRAAAANLREARALLSEPRAGRLPTTDIGAGASYGQVAGSTLGVDGAGPRGETYDAGLDIGYQVDLFGRIGRAIEASEADAEAVRAAYDLTRITVAAETSRAYAEVCGYGRRIEVARESLRVQERTFDLTRRLFEGGRATALDTNRAQAQLDQVRADLPTLEAERRAALYRLAVLTGRPPLEFSAEVADCTSPPSVLTPLPVGDGASLLARRPDVRAAERQLAAATARIGVATAELYPSVSFGASVGSTANAIGDIGSSQGFRFGIGPLLSWSFPNTAVARARIVQAEARADAALATFDGTWLTALQETESALARFARQQSRIAILSSARDASAEAARIARLRYEAGRESFQIVLETEQNLAASEALLAQAQAQLANDGIMLFLALGGGWEAEPLQTGGAFVSDEPS